LERLFHAGRRQSASVNVYALLQRACSVVRRQGPRPALGDGLLGKPLRMGEQS
jgi:hypothetical protein